MMMMITMYIGGSKIRLLTPLNIELYSKNYIEIGLPEMINDENIPASLEFVGGFLM